MKVKQFLKELNKVLDKSNLAEVIAKYRKRTRNEYTWGEAKAIRRYILRKMGKIFRRNKC